MREGFVLLLRGGSSKPLLTELAEEPEAFLWHALLLVLLSHVAQICVLLPEVLATHFTNKWPLLCPTGYHMVSVPTLLAKWVATLGAFLFRAKWYIMLVKPVEVHRPLLIRTVPTVIDPAVMLVPTLMLSAKVAPQWAACSTNFLARYPVAFTFLFFNPHCPTTHPGWMFPLYMCIKVFRIVKTLSTPALMLFSFAINLW